jgi:prepilin-type N-terminal cleavage/methylation domain-containing protein
MNALFSRQPARRDRRGFTMTELMVVIGIIAVLAGILLTAMSGVRRRALSTRTESTMQEFAKACEAFQIEQNRYPGLIPEPVLAEVYAADSELELSGTENALLDLMGGARAHSETFDPDNPHFNDIDDCGSDPWILCPVVSGTSAQWELKVDVNRIGEGPLLDGRIAAPYFTPAESALAGVEGQLWEPDSSGTYRIPDLIDAWGQPIVYVRRARESGALVGDFGDPAQFFTASMKPYTESEKLGRMGFNQMSQSILNTTNADPNATFAEILRHPGFGSYGTVTDALSGTPRGGFILFSAGPDGIYFSTKDGPGTPKAPVDNIVDNSTEDSYNSPRVVQEYDDLRVFGGG